MLNELLLSVMEQDTAPVVICDIDWVIVYMNPAAKQRYHRDLTGKSLRDCHNEDSNKKMERVLLWFKESSENNRVYTYYNGKENKDVYMIALRDAHGELIGFYEKNE